MAQSPNDRLLSNPKPQGPPSTHPTTPGPQTSSTIYPIDNPTHPHSLAIGHKCNHTTTSALFWTSAWIDDHILDLVVRSSSRQGENSSNHTRSVGFSLCSLRIFIHYLHFINNSLFLTIPIYFLVFLNVHPYAHGSTFLSHTMKYFCHTE